VVLIERWPASPPPPARLPSAAAAPLPVLGAWPAKARGGKRDPYVEQVTATAAAVAGRLGLAREDWSLCFQSRVGPLEWVRPYIDEGDRPAGADACRSCRAGCFRLGAFGDAGRSSTGIIEASGRIRRAGL